MQTRQNPEDVLDTALAALSTGSDWRTVLDELAVPIYTTDSEGAVTYWNRACVDFAGRQPQLGQDRWCVTWKIYTTTGEFMPHEKCPMADAIHKREAVRGKVAIAMRPDGSRRAFTPYPTPLFDAEGNFTGAINLLVDVTEQQREVLAAQASRCRRLAAAMYNRETSGVLEGMAEQFDRTAAELRLEQVR
jgi:PAS domain S-box-containing protein